MKINKIKLLMLLIIVILNIVVVRNIAYAQTWDFAVISDTHDSHKSSTTTGVTSYLSPIINFIAAEKPDIVIETGDLITGVFTKPTSPVYKRYDANMKLFKK